MYFLRGFSLCQIYFLHFLVELMIIYVIVLHKLNILGYMLITCLVESYKIPLLCWFISYGAAVGRLLAYLSIKTWLAASFSLSKL